VPPRTGAEQIDRHENKQRPTPQGDHQNDNPNRPTRKQGKAKTVGEQHKKAPQAKNPDNEKPKTETKKKARCKRKP
jgi:hypothetical protein